MTLVINAINEEFAASTGANVNTSPNSSRFDYPPNASHDLVITSNPGDPSPYTFEVGDTYDLAFGGMGGSTTMDDATIIRSDIKPDGTHVVVFEGTDQNGDLVQVVWTPGFDLEGWYWSNFNNGSSPEFYTADQDASSSVTFACFVAGTRIDTPAGPVPVERLRAGDLVTTVDRGPQPLLWSGSRKVRASRRSGPVSFAPGVLGNRRPLAVSYQHRMLLGGAAAEIHFGVPEVLAPAGAFLGLPGVDWQPRPSVTFVHLLLQRHELLLAEDAVTESILLGPTAQATLGDLGRQLSAQFPSAARVAVRPLLTVREAGILGNLGTWAGAVPAAAIWGHRTPCA